MTILKSTGEITDLWRTLTSFRWSSGSTLGFSGGPTVFPSLMLTSYQRLLKILLMKLSTLSFTPLLLVTSMTELCGTESNALLMPTGDLRVLWSVSQEVVVNQSENALCVQVRLETGLSFIPASRNSKGFSEGGLKHHNRHHYAEVWRERDEQETFDISGWLA